jgi:hypothetical protein
MSNLGCKPISKAMKNTLNYKIIMAITSRKIKCNHAYPEIIVHHYSDKEDNLQLEYELRYNNGTCQFGRLVVKE